MTSSEAEADEFLAGALRGAAPWPPGLDPGRVVARALDHGVAGALAGCCGDWPAEAAEPLRRAARAQAMWEMRHHQVLAALLRRFEAEGLRVLVLKGSALAYDLYDRPHERARGDSDLLVAPADLPAARRLLGAEGLACGLADPDADAATRREEGWSLRTPDGLEHDIDLHWQALNAPALSDVIPFVDAWARARPLPRLGPGARGLPLDLALVLACVHRAVHLVSPYYVGGRAHHGGDRLVWLLDIDLLARALGPGDWDRVVATARTSGVAGACLDGLLRAAGRLETPVPPRVLADLSRSPPAAADRYLRSGGRVARMWRDLLATRGLAGRAAYLRAGLFPNAAHMRSKYPALAGRPLPLLHLRRVAEFVAAQLRGGRG
ncbi:nucleotidyltransferase family protein [Rubellimicrobium mesophilum]|nr:nucleotidyltransferase family protein [Rubellimicrobium mesophilum]